MTDKAVKPVSGVADADREAAARPRRILRPGNGSEAWLRAIVDSAVDGIITIDELGSITDLNPAALRLFGYSADELIGQNVKILMPEPYHAGHDAYLRNYRETGVRKIIGIGREVAGKRKDGSVFPLDLAVSEVQRGGRRMFTGIVRDISERKRIEAEWQKFVGLVENSSDFMAMASLSWELLYINKAGRQLLGIGPEQVKGMEVRDLWEEDTLPAVLKKAGPGSAQRRLVPVPRQGQALRDRPGHRRGLQRLRHTRPAQRRTARHGFLLAGHARPNASRAGPARRRGAAQGDLRQRG